jgi:hypothetical protein
LESSNRRNPNAQVDDRASVSRPEADNLEEACKKGISDDIDWDFQEMDCDNARATSITAAKLVPEEYEADQAHSMIIASRDPEASRWACSAWPPSSTRMREDGPLARDPREIH